MKKHLLFFFAALLPLLARAEAVEIDGIWYNLDTEAKTAEVISEWTQYSGSIVIPSTLTYNDAQYSVTSIGWGAFANCKDLINVTIPRGVTLIEENAFIGCSGLSSINIPNSVTCIGKYAFENCSGITTIVVEEGNTIYDSRNDCNAIIETNSNTLIVGCSSTIIPKGTTSIGDNAFSGCCSLTYINIPKSVTSIGLAAFSNCSGLTSINIPDSIIKIEHYAFWGCSSLEDIVVGEGNKIYDSREGCNAVIETKTNTLIIGCKTTRIPTSVTSIGENAFSGCSNLTSIIIPENVTEIRCDAFYNCNGLTSISIPNGVIRIEDYTFYNCYSLNKINIPESVTWIGVNAFSYCSNLTCIVLPKNVEIICYEAFGYCPELLDVYCYAENVPRSETESFSESNLEKVTLHVLASAIESYKNTAPWSNFGNIVALTEAETGIENPEFKVQNSEIIYDLQGRKVTNPVRGIYIKDGRKVAIK